MAWKIATSFVLAAETWLGAEGEDAIFIIGVSFNEGLAVLQRTKRGDPVGFSDPKWLATIGGLRAGHCAARGLPRATSSS